MSTQELATFLYVMMANLENDIFEQLTSQGVQLDLVRPMPQVQIQEYEELLETEVDDDEYTEYFRR